jgi:hypothetical protein
MDIDKVYDTVQATKEPAIQRQLIMNYILSFVKTLEDDPEARQDIAYNIATLSSTDYAQGLDEDDTLVITLEFAGELEDAEEDNEDWALLVEIIKSLE